MSEAVPPGCNDCGAAPGGEHQDSCDVARCLVTGLQRLMCDAGHDCGQDVWTGAWPGAAECSEFAWSMFPRASPEHLPDLNRLILQARWDQQARRWRRPGDPVDDIFYVHWHVGRGYALPQARYTMDGVTVPEEALPALLAEIAARTARPDTAAAGGPASTDFPGPLSGQPPSARKPAASHRPGRPGPRRRPPTP